MSAPRTRPARYPTVPTNKATQPPLSRATRSDPGLGPGFCSGRGGRVSRQPTWLAQIAKRQSARAEADRHVSSISEACRPRADASSCLTPPWTRRTRLASAVALRNSREAGAAAISANPVLRRLQEPRPRGRRYSSLRSSLPGTRRRTRSCLRSGRRWPCPGPLGERASRPCLPGP
jgi:hypothetical protein